MSRFQKWALATTIATYFLIMVGGIVRASGAGLGCPDWPKCFDRYYPPLNESQVPASIDPALFNFQLAWTEYINRLVGVTIGLLIIGTLYFAVRYHRDNKRILYPAIASFVLVLFQGWLGGVVVQEELAPWLVTAHMILALVLVSLLLYATVEAFFPNPLTRHSLPADRRLLAKVTMVVLLITLGQVSLGANLREELEHIQNDQPTIARADIIAEAGLIDQVHRSYSWLILAGVVALLYLTHKRMRRDHPWLRKLAQLNLGMVLLQVLAGIGLAYGGLPPVLQVVHLLNASVLVGGLTLLFLLTNRLPISRPTMPDNNGLQSSLSQEPALH